MEYAHTPTNNTAYTQGLDTHGLDKHCVDKHSSVAGTSAVTMRNQSSDVIASQLAYASTKNKWILFTGHCPKPDLNWLSARNVDCSKVVYLKNSEHSEQIKVIMDAILSGNAAAVIGTNAIDAISQQQLSKLAQDNDCSVHFVDISRSRKLH
jgi:cell division inhibitor SulA